MPISAGTYTYGAGGTYATLRAAFIDMESAPGSAVGTLTGDLTLTQVGDSDDSSAVVGENAADTQINLNLFGHTLTINSAFPHIGCALNAFATKYKSFLPRFNNSGAIVLDDFYGLGSVGGLGFNPFLTVSGPFFFTVQDSIVRCLEPTRAAAYIMPSPSSGTSNFKGINSKFSGVVDALETGWAGSSGNQDRCTIAIENCVFQSTGMGAPSNFLSGPFRLGVADFILGVQPRVNLASFRNNICVVADPTTQRAFAQAAGTGPVGTDEAFYRAIFLSCAKTGGIDSNTGFDYPAITSPADILSLSPAVCDWLNVNPASALFTAGSAPILSSPYSPPYPIGISYAAPAPVTSLWMPAFVGSL